MRLVQVSFRERAGIDKNEAPELQFRQFDLQGRRVHGDHHVTFIAGSFNHVGTEVDLKRRYAERGTSRGPNFRWKIRESGEIIPRHCRGLGELAAGKLNPVSRVTGKTDDRGSQFLTMRESVRFFFDRC